MILDGFGIAPEKGNAIKAANKPNIDKLFAENPVTQIGASGMDVGLPDGQMGNSQGWPYKYGRRQNRISGAYKNYKNY